MGEGSMSVEFYGGPLDGQKKSLPKALMDYYEPIPVDTMSDYAHELRPVESIPSKSMVYHYEKRAPRRVLGMYYRGEEER